MQSQLRGARAVAAQLRDALTCPDCGKSRAVLNTGGYRQPFRGERVTAESHCACPGGPAACTVCGGYGEIDDPGHPGLQTDPFTPPLIPCPHPTCTARRREGGAR